MQMALLDLSCLFDWSKQIPFCQCRFFPRWPSTLFPLSHSGLCQDTAWNITANKTTLDRVRFFSRPGETSLPKLLPKPPRFPGLRGGPRQWWVCCPRCILVLGSEVTGICGMRGTHDACRLPGYICNMYSLYLRLECVAFTHQCHALSVQHPWSCRPIYRSLVR